MKTKNAQLFLVGHIISNIWMEKEGREILITITDEILFLYGTSAIGLI
jgi:hypothetical protein